jgi:hypothetical protein
MQTKRALLGLHRSSSREELSTSYRRVVRRLHPDRMIGATAQERAAATDLLGRVNRANDILQTLQRAGEIDSRVPTGSFEPSTAQSSDSCSTQASPQGWGTAPPHPDSSPRSDEFPSDAATAHMHGAESANRAWPFRRMHGSSTALAIIGLLVLTCVGAALALPSTEEPPGPTATAVGVEPASMRNEMDAGTTAEVYLTWAKESGCRSSDGCWIAHATSAGACTAADVVATFTRTTSGKAGPSTRFSIENLMLISTLSITASAAPYQHVRLSATCTRKAQHLTEGRRSDVRR